MRAWKKDLRRDRCLFGILLASYLAVALGYKSLGLTPLQAFPVFAWDLFTTVPQDVKENWVLVQQIDDKVLTQPRNLRDYWRPLRRNDPANYFPIPRDLAKAVETGNEDEAQRIVRAIRKRYFTGSRRLRFTLVEASYDPLVYWHDHGQARFRTLRDFDFTSSTSGFEEGAP